MCNCIYHAYIIGTTSLYFNTNWFVRGAITNKIGLYEVYIAIDSTFPEEKKTILFVLICNLINTELLNFIVINYSNTIERSSLCVSFLAAATFTFFHMHEWIWYNKKYILEFQNLLLSVHSCLKNKSVKVVFQFLCIIALIVHDSRFMGLCPIYKTTHFIISNELIIH